MSNYKGHVVGGVVTFAALVALVQPAASWLTWGEWCAFTLGGALFPDVDIKSKGQKLFYRLILLALVYFLIQKRTGPFMFLGLTAMMPMVVKHRGLFKKTRFIIACSATPIILTYLYQPRYVGALAGDAVFFCAGAFSHLVLDRGFAKVIRQLCLIG